MRNITFAYGPYGDITTHWESQNDDKVLPVIQQLIDSGVRFFIVEPASEAPASTLVTSTDQVLANRTIVLPDAALEELHKAGLVITVQGAIEGTAGPHIAGTAEEVAAADTVAVQPAKGG